MANNENVNKKEESWAEREVRLACEHERRGNGTNDDEFDYDVACYKSALYKSALKAYKSLAEDGHSGYSIRLTKNVLNRLIEHKPLIPIEDTDDVWFEVHDEMPRHPGIIKYQCKRMGSLWKKIDENGNVSYIDNNRAVGIGINDKIPYTSGLTTHIYDDMYPITMPYMPYTEPAYIFTEELLTDRKNGDFDTTAVYYAELPNGTRVDINRYFCEPPKDHDGELYYGWLEINEEEFKQRKILHDKREAEEKLNESETIEK